MTLSCGYCGVTLRDSVYDAHPCNAVTRADRALLDALALFARALVTGKTVDRDDVLSALDAYERARQAGRVTG